MPVMSAPLAQQQRLGHWGHGTINRVRQQQRNCAARTRCFAVAAAAQAQPKATLAFHIADTTFSFPLRAEEAHKLSAALTEVMKTFAEKQKAERPKRYPSMEYTFKGDIGAREVEQLEVICNPNAYATAFDAKALITLRTADGLRLSTEGKLTAIKADVEEFLGQL